MDFQNDIAIDIFTASITASLFTMLVFAVVWWVSKKKHERYTREFRKTIRNHSAVSDDQDKRQDQGGE